MKYIKMCKLVTQKTVMKEDELYIIENYEHQTIIEQDTII